MTTRATGRLGDPRPGRVTAWNTGAVSGLVGVAWGGMLVVGGERVWSTVAGRPPTAPEVWAVRLLGARHLLQGLAQLAAPRPALPVAAGVDLVHCTTMAVLAAFDRPRARPALVSGTVSLAAAALAWAAIVNVRDMSGAGASRVRPSSLGAGRIVIRRSRCAATPCWPTVTAAR